MEERLTKWVDDGDEKFAITNPFIRSNGHQKCLTKLAEYEDLNISPEEMRQIYSEWLVFKEHENNEGRVKPRFQVGDTVFVVWGLELCETEITRITIWRDNSFSYEWDLAAAKWQGKDEFYDHEIGRRVFMTREAAEERLNENKIQAERLKR